MKLKEKLAEEYKASSTCIEELHLGCLTRDAYLAGFDMARNLAAEKIKTSIAPEGNQAFDDSVINQRLQAKHDHDLCLSLGEEEVS